MRILVVGGYGLIGGYAVARLVAEGHEVIGAGRNIGAAQRRFPNTAWRLIDLSTATAADWAEAFDGVQAVVNCAGALQNSPRDDLAAVHVGGLAALVEGARLARVARVVQISAVGVADSPGEFGATKRAAEAVLQAAEIDWIILRPGLVLAPAAFGGSALLRGLAAFPFLIPAVYADNLVQVVSVRDLTRAVVAAVQPATPGRTIVDLVADEPHTLGEVLVALRAWLGLPAAPVVRMPVVLSASAAIFADALSWLGWRSPMRSAALAQLKNGVRGKYRATEGLEFRIRDLSAILASEPSGVQERWFSRLYFLKPLTIGVLALFWTISGVIGLAQSDKAVSELAMTGIGEGTARLLVLLGSIADIVVGVMACHRATARLALKGMLAISAAYLVGATVWRADLWVAPLGPILKVLPAALLACVALALLDER